MKLDEFSSSIDSHGELEGSAIMFGADEAADRIIVKRRSDGCAIALPARLVADLDWPVLERIILGQSPPRTTESLAPESLENALPWSRSHFGLLKDRLVRSYSVETLLSR